MRLRQALGEEGLQRVELAARHGQARRHGVAAALDEMAVGHGGAHGRADVDAGNGAQRAGALAGLVPGDHAGGAVEAVGEPARHQADHALVPAVGADQQQGHVGVGLDQLLGAGHRLLEHVGLDGLALAVELVEQHGDARGLHLVAGREQARAEAGIADAPAGVDARAQHEAQMIGRGRDGEAGGVGERLEAGVAAQAHDLQALGDIGAVEALERHHVAHGGERDEVEEIEQRGRRPVWPRRSRGGAARAGSPPAA